MTLMAFAKQSTDRRTTVESKSNRSGKHRTKDVRMKGEGGLGKMRTNEDKRKGSLSSYVDIHNLAVPYSKFKAASIRCSYCAFVREIMYPTQ